MIVKVLIISLAFSNVFAFFTSQTNESFDEVKIKWERWEELGRSFTSSLLSTNPNFIPIRDWTVIEPEIEAKSASIFKISSIDPALAKNSELKENILYEKNIDLILPIASITKLMTALITLERTDDLSKNIIISENAIKAYGGQGGLIVNEEISIINTLHVLLMESSNDAAVALSEVIGEKSNTNFIDLMNAKAKELNLENTFFADPSGYNAKNVSTIKDIVKLIKYSFSQPTIWKILKTPEIDLTSDNGKIKHHLVNTDKLLNRMPNIIGGKTGYTTEAQGCLVLVIEQDKLEESNKYLITVVLGAQERFLQTEKLIEWVNEAYKW
ncbi:hypothetical protein KKH96_03090 [Patescibacteria group bacterium]|nr:hypothetical protein [Patescibacteria group bacterium]